MLMHSVIYRTQLLRDCGMTLPKHTFYVDELYVYIPLRNVEKMYYLDVDFYHYFIGREVNRLLVSSIDPFSIEDEHKRKYMLNYLEIVTTVSSVLLTKSGTEENLQKKKELWEFIEKENPKVYDTLRHRLMGRALHLPGKSGRDLTIGAYKIAQKIFGFN